MPDTPDVREQIAAYLAGDLDAAESAALEARMVSEPWVADAADDLADMLVRLGGVDEVEPPAGFGDRLRAALAAEIGHELPAAPPDRARPDRDRDHMADVLRGSGAAAADGWSARPPARSDARRPGATRRAGAGRRRLSTAVMGVAAALTVLFVGSATVLLGGGISSDDSDSADVADSADEGRLESATLREFAEEDAAEEVAEEAEAAAQDAAAGLADDSMTLNDPAGDTAAEDAVDAGSTAASSAAQAPAPVNPGDESTEDEAAGGGAARPSGPPGPEVVAIGPVDGSDDTVRDLVGRRAAAEVLLGTAVEDATALADPFRDEILRSPPHPNGTAAGACLTDVLTGVDAVVVPAVAAQLEVDGTERLAFALVRSTDGAVLDRIDVWVVDPDSCAVVSVVS